MTGTLSIIVAASSLWASTRAIQIVFLLAAIAAIGFAAYDSWKEERSRANAAEKDLAEKINGYAGSLSLSAFRLKDLRNTDPTALHRTLELTMQLANSLDRPIRYTMIRTTLDGVDLAIRSAKHLVPAKSTFDFRCAGAKNSIRVDHEPDRHEFSFQFEYGPVDSAHTRRMTKMVDLMFWMQLNSVEFQYQRNGDQDDPI